MGIAERLLLACCHGPDEPDYAGGTVRANVSNALQFLDKTVPNFRALVRGRVLDFGCGRGHQAVAMALQCEAQEVVGLEIGGLEYAQRLAREHGCEDRVRFAHRLAPRDSSSFDLVLSCSSMEHFSEPERMVELMKTAVKPGGVIVISFAEPWYGPRGSHFDSYSRLPWVNLLFSENVVLRVRSQFRSDGATRYCDIEGGLNQMSLAKFERILRASGLEIGFYRTYMAKNLPVGRVPIIRELFASAAAAVLRNPGYGVANSPVGCCTAQSTRYE